MHPVWEKAAQMTYDTTDAPARHRWTGTLILARRMADLPIPADPAECAAEQVVAERVITVMRMRARLMRLTIRENRVKTAKRPLLKPARED